MKSEDIIMDDKWLAKYISLGIRFTTEGDRLQCSAPPGVLTAEIVDELKRNKAAILALLASSESSEDPFRDEEITIAEDKEYYKLSPPQRRYMADFTWDSERSWSTVIFQAPFPVVCDKEVYLEAFEEICRRYDCLRTTFPVVNGERMQRIGSESSVAFLHEDLGDVGEREIENRLNELQALTSKTHWDCENGPLGKFYLLTNKKGSSNRLLISFHRVVMDASSVKYLLSEYMRSVMSLKTGQILPGDSKSKLVRYRDFSEWLNGLEDKGSFLRSRDYWRKELKGPLPDPFGFNSHGNPSLVSKKAALAIREITLKQVSLLQEHATESGWLFPMMLFSIYAASLWCAGSGDEIVFDGSLSGRHRPELRQNIGFFTNAAAIRLVLEPDKPFSSLVANVTQKFALAEKNQYFQYNSVIDDLGYDRKKILFPLSGILFNIISVDIASSQMTRERKAWQEVSTEARYGASFYAMFHPDCLSLELRHRLSLMDAETANNIVDTYVRVVNRLIQTKQSMTLRQLVGLGAASASEVV